MKTIKVKNYEPIPRDYTGIVEREDGNKCWLKHGNLHREDGPAYIEPNGYKSWRLNGNYIWDSYNKLDLTNKIILSKTQRSEYPSVQIWKILGKNGLYEQVIIPGMEELIKE